MKNKIYSDKAVIMTGGIFYTKLSAVNPHMSNNIREHVLLVIRTVQIVLNSLFGILFSLIEQLSLFWHANLLN